MESFEQLKQINENLSTFYELIAEDETILTDMELIKENHHLYETFIKKINSLEIESLLSNKYDAGNCILSINSGAGGTDAQDWAHMLYRMYSRYIEKNKLSISVVDENPGDEAGIKSITLVVTGEFAYGYLSQEIGIHRLVRLSPFNANNKRQTSFASVDVLPEINHDSEEINIDPKDLKIDTFRASGAGGQHVNKTDSAVRITHIPTGVVSTSQSSRSQNSNKESALSILKSRLFVLLKEQQKKEISDIRGDVKDNAWGNQIRSYVMHPYKMVKDLRTNYETSNIEKVLDGDIDDFIQHHLRLKRAVQD